MEWLFVIILTTMVIQLQAKNAVILTTCLPSLKDTYCKVMPESQASAPSKGDKLNAGRPPENNSIQGNAQQCIHSDKRISIYYPPNEKERIEPVLPSVINEDAREIRLVHTNINESTQKPPLYTAILDDISDKDKEVPLTNKDKTRYSWLGRSNPCPWHRLADTLIIPSQTDITIKKAYSYQWVRARDNKNNVIFQWYDHNGRLLYSLNEDTYYRRKSMYFYLLLELLIPYIFEPSFPPLGGWHRWEYKLRQVPRKPQKSENTKYTPCVCKSPDARDYKDQTCNGRQGDNVANGRKPISSDGQRAQSFSLVNNGRPAGALAAFDMMEIQRACLRWGKNYTGYEHRACCVTIKVYSLGDDDWLDANYYNSIPFMEHLTRTLERVTFSPVNLVTCLYSLTQSGLLYFPGNHEIEFINAQYNLNIVFLVALVNLGQKRDSLDGRNINNSLLAVEKMVAHGMPINLPVVQEALRALLSAIDLTRAGEFNPQNISGILLSVAKLLEHKMPEKTYINKALRALLSAIDLTRVRRFDPHEIGGSLLAVAKLLAHKMPEETYINKAVEALLSTIDLTEAGGFNPYEISRSLLSVEKLVEHGVSIDLPCVQGALRALLSAVAIQAGIFTMQDISRSLLAVAKLVAHGIPIPIETYVEKAVEALLPSIDSTKLGRSNPQEISTSLRAIEKMVAYEMPIELEVEKAVAVLLSAIDLTQAVEFNPQEISNSLQAIEKLLAHGMPAEFPFAQEAVEALLSAIDSSKAGGFNSLDISSSLLSVANLVAHGISINLPFVQGALRALLSAIVTNSRGFNLQKISASLWAIEKIVAHGMPIPLEPYVEKAAEALLSAIDSTKAGGFKPRDISSSLLSMANLVVHGVPIFIEPYVEKAVEALLSSIDLTNAGGFNMQDISSSLLSLRKLVAHGMSINLPFAQGALRALLSAIGATKAGGFKPQDISISLLSVAKLVAHGIPTPIQPYAEKAVEVLLSVIASTKAGGLNPEDISNSLLSVAKLVAHGVPIDLPCVQRVLPVLLSAIDPGKATNFNHEDISNSLWALAFMGKTSELNSIVDVFNGYLTDDFFRNANQEGKTKTLWALCVWLVKNDMTKHSANIKIFMHSLYGNLSSEQNTLTNMHKIIFASARVLLGDAVELQEKALEPTYDIQSSEVQKNVARYIRQRFPGTDIEEEWQCHNLAPVDIAFPYYKLVIEVQGPFHYLDKKKCEHSNGKTILKKGVYSKAGFRVVEFPVSDFGEKAKMENLMLLIKQHIEMHENKKDRISGQSIMNKSLQSKQAIIASLHGVLTPGGNS